MIIDKVCMQNFQCYSGALEENVFTFKTGLNVIIGDNGSGKSKLYDAFYWLLYDKVFNSANRVFEPTSHVGINLASDKAKAAAQVGDYIGVKVQLYMSESKDNGSVPVKYLLERSITFKRIKDVDDYNDVSAWKADGNSITKVEMNDILNFKPLTGAGDFGRIVKKLLPRDMEPYLWFQGEQVDSLIDFKNEDSLKKAIDVLSGIRVFDNYIEVAQKVSKQANDAYNREERQLLKNNSSSEHNLKEKERLQKLIEKEEKNLKDIEDNLAYAEEHKEELLGKIEDAKELERLKAELSTAKGEITRAQNILSEGRKGFNSNLFSKKWLLRNAGAYLERFEEMQKVYDEKREDLRIAYKIEQQQEEARKHRLPENVPNKQYLEEMLGEKKCFLCDREFEEGDAAYNYLNDILERTKNRKVRITDFLKQDLKKHFQGLYSNAYSLYTYQIPNIDESIGEEIEKLDLLESKLADKIKKYEDKEQEFNHILSTGSVSEDEALNIVRSFRESDKSKDKFTENKIQTESRIEYNKGQLAIIEEELKKSSGGEMDTKIVEKKEVLDRLLKATLSTRNMVYYEQIKRIEELANTHFYQMTRENKSVQGKIVLEKRGNNYMPKNVDDNGVELTSINDSNIILIKLATIMAIVSAKGGTELHPLISDAPTSKFSDNYTIGFCKTLSEVFNQSIIISYDFFHNLDLRDRLLKDIESLGTVTLIEPSQPEDQRMNRTDLTTNITVINE